VIRVGLGARAIGPLPRWNQNVKIIDSDTMVVRSEKSAPRSNWNFFQAKPMPAAV
jgi:hypothetical protein